MFSFTEPCLFKKRFCSQNQRTEVSDASSLDSLIHVFILQQVFTEGLLHVKLQAWKWNMNLNKTQSLSSKNLQLRGEEKQIDLFSQHRGESPLLAHASAVGACPEDLNQ